MLIVFSVDHPTLALIAAAARSICLFRSCSE